MWAWQQVTAATRGLTIQGSILIVEDDDAIRTMLISVLEVAEYEVRAVRSGAEALATLGAWRPDAIVLDPFSAGSDGYEFLARRADRGSLADAPIVVVTPSTASLPSARRLGVRAVLQRPHDVNQLLMLVAEAIRDPRGRDALRG